MIQVNNCEDLLTHLSTVDISVPGRATGRTSEHTERYTVCRLLSTLSMTRHISYPLLLEKRERPDFLLCCNGTDIGIEVTEATSEDYSEHLAYAAKNTPQSFIQPSHFRYDRPLGRQKKNNLLAQTQLTGYGWAGDEPEKEWSLYIRDAIISKSRKLMEPNFQKFLKNWLLVYDNTPCSFLNKELLLPHIQNLASNEAIKNFDAIFVETGWHEEDHATASSIIICLAQSNIEIFDIKDLWSKNAI